MQTLPTLYRRTRNNEVEYWYIRPIKVFAKKAVVSKVSGYSDMLNERVQIISVELAHESVQQCMVDEWQKMYNLGFQTLEQLRITHAPLVGPSMYMFHGGGLYTFGLEYCLKQVLPAYQEFS